MRAEAKKGELLGPAVNQGRRTDLELVTAGDKSPDGAERMDRQRARAVAKVAAEQPEVFEEYLATAEEPTRASVTSPKPR